MERCRASLVLLSIFVVFTNQNIFVDFELSTSGTQVQVTSVHCPCLIEIEYVTSTSNVDNTNEPATVLS
eukprot:6336402-Amphidinium_carterae.1